jgi:putative ubiquitin-RnfH superfamily antitoxin RatB of RatAB toxin-antitoxin module
MRILVVYAAVGVEAQVTLELWQGATVADAVAASGLAERVGVPVQTLSFAIHGERAAPTLPLEDGDRVELLRPLLADPREVRRRRAQEKPLPRPAPRRKRHP